VQLRKIAWALLFALAMLPACGRGRGRTLEVMYVSAPQAFLRDRVAAVYNKTATVKNGDRLDVLDREKRFIRVRTSNGTEGWIEQRYLITQQVFDHFQSLTKDHQNDPIQATGRTRNDNKQHTEPAPQHDANQATGSTPNVPNPHHEPGRDTDRLYLLPAASKVSVLARGMAERTGVVAPPSPGKKDKAPGLVMEDWWLARDAQGHVGWLLARMVDLDVPLEIAQYAEGQRFVAFFKLNEV